MECSKCRHIVYPDHRYCTNCGHMLQLPQTVAELEHREKVAEEVVVHSHSFMKTFSLYDFCPQCGKRL